MPDILEQALDVLSAKPREQDILGEALKMLRSAPTEQLDPSVLKALQATNPYTEPTKEWWQGIVGKSGQAEELRQGLFEKYRPYGPRPTEGLTRLAGETEMLDPRGHNVIERLAGLLDLGPPGG